jgi:thiol-disulfide isomerase/thioredoxin
VTEPITKRIEGACSLVGIDASRFLVVQGASIDNTTIALRDYQGKVVLIEFWATWCAPCVAELPKLKQLRRELGPSQFVLLGITLDDDKSHLKKFLAQKEIDWPIIVDDAHNLAGRWQALSLPVYYVLDLEHVVRYRGKNFQSAASVAKSLVGPDESAAIAELVSMTLQAFDANKDQRLEKDELPDDKKVVLETADLNKDGSLSVDELTKFLKENMTTTKADPNSPSADQ